MRIPFSKSEIFQNGNLGLKEKRQLVRVIQFCLSGYDKLSNKEVTMRQINSTHVYDKLDIELSKAEFTLLCDYKDRPVVQFLYHTASYRETSNFGHRYLFPRTGRAHGLTRGVPLT